MKFWLCEEGTNLDDGGLRPGELMRDFFGDTICIYCNDKINFAVRLMANPELIPLVRDMKKLASEIGAEDMKPK